MKKLRAAQLRASLERAGAASDARPDDAFVEDLGARLRSMDRTEVVATPTDPSRGRLPERIWIPLACAAAVVAVLLLGTALEPAHRQHVSAGSPGGGPIPPPAAEITTTTTTQFTVPTTTGVVPAPPATTTSTVAPEGTKATLTMSCQPVRGGSVTCSWSRSDLPAFNSYVLLRSTVGARGRVVTQTTVRTATTATDVSVPSGAVNYVVDVLDSTGRTLAHSNPVIVTCC